MRETRLKKISVVARRCAVASAALVLSVAIGSSQVRAQVIDQVPAEALVVLKVKNLKATSDKIAKLANDLGVAAMAPPLSDPLKALQDKAHITQGLNPAGDLYFVYIDPSVSMETQDKSMAILIPVSDYKAFLANYPDAKTDGDVSEIQMPDSPQTSFVANWGTYAALSPSKLVAGKKPTTSLKTTAAAAKELDTKEITLLANVAGLRALLQPEIAKNRDEILAKAEDELKKNPKSEKMVPVAKAAINQLLNIADSTLRDGEAATIGIGLGDEGLKITELADFTPGSYLGNTMASVKNTSEPLLGGLPAGKYLFFEGGAMDPAMSTKLATDLIDPVVKDIVAASPDFAGLTDAATSLKQTLGATKGFSAGMVAPAGQLGQEAILQMIGTYSGDPKAISDGIHKTMDAQGEIYKAMGMGDTMKSTLTPNAKTVDGVSFDSLTTTMTGDPQSPMAAQQQQIMTMMYGPGGMTQNFGIVGDRMVFASGVPDAEISSLIASAKTGEAPLSNLDQVKKVAANLPSSRAFECYVPVDQVVTTALVYAKQFGFAVPVQLPPDLPPLGATISTDASALKIDFYIPTPLVQSLVAAGMQAAMQMQGGGGGGGGGGAGGGL